MHVCGCCWRVDLAKEGLAGFGMGVNGFEWIQIGLGGKLLLDNTQLAACYRCTLIITWKSMPFWQVMPAALCHIPIVANCCFFKFLIALFYHTQVDQTMTH
jgi:hypothetical protein